MFAVFSRSSIFVAACWAVASIAHADQIVLRNFDVLRNVTVESYDEDGIRLESGKSVSWDQVEAATVSKDADAFAKMLKELGDPLYRIRQRLSIGDYRGLLDYAEKLESRYAKRTSDSAYWVALGLMWGRIADGRREMALAPYLRCYTIHKLRDANPPKAPGDRNLEFDSKTGMTSQLIPIWFDPKLAKEALPLALAAVSSMPKPAPDGARIYVGSLAIAAGDLPRAEQALSKPLEGSVENVRRILQAQQQIQSGETQAGRQALTILHANLLPKDRPLARYWIGYSRTAEASEDAKRQGLLDLLRLPASHGEQHPDLAAAGLHRAMQVLEELKDVSGSIRVRRELLERYGQTYHAGLQKPERTTEEKP